MLVNHIVGRYRYLTFALPGIQVVATVTKSSQALLRSPTGAADAPGTLAQAYEEAVPMHVDTVCLMPDERRLYMVWRGLCRVLDITALEVTKIHIAEQALRVERR